MPKKSSPRRTRAKSGSPARRVPFWAFFLGAVVWVAYVLGRGAVAAKMPYYDWNGYLRQDGWITLLRAICFLCVLTLGLITLGIRRLFVGSGRFALPTLAVGIWMTAAVYFFVRPLTSPPVGWGFRFTELGIAAVVAANEEMGFRGLFFEFFRERTGIRWVAWITSALFVLMHLGYEPAWDFPFIFLTAMVLSRLRGLGVSLIPLIIIHTAVDGVWALKLPEGLPKDPLAFWVQGFMVAGAWLLLEIVPNPKASASLA